MEYIAIFKGTVTAGGTDGTEVSVGLWTVPIEATLHTGASSTQTCAVRCATGCSASTVELTSVSSWLKLSTDNTTFSDSITLNNVGDTNKLFYVMMTAGSNVGVENGAIELEATVVRNV